MEKNFYDISILEYAEKNRDIGSILFSLYNKINIHYLKKKREYYDKCSK